MSELKEPDTFAALEKREWAKADVAQSYAQVFAMAADMVVPYLVKAVSAQPGTKALDLCCGHGNVALGLIRAGAEVTGLDFSAAMLEMARTAVPEAEFIEGDAMDLSFDDRSFDAVTIGFGMPHVPDPPHAAAIRAAVVSKVLEKHGKGPFWRVPIPAVVTSAVAV